MSILTKIFVVLTTILAVLLVPLMVAYVNNTDHYKGELESTQKQLAAAVERAQIVEVQLTNRQKEDSAREAEMQGTIASLQNKLNERAAQIQTLQATMIAKEDELTRKSADLSAAVRAKEQSQQIIDKLNTEVLQRRKEAIEAQRDLLAVTDQLQEKTADLESLNEQVRLLQEQLADLDAQLADAKKAQLTGAPSGGTASAPSTPAATTLTGTPVRGLVTQVESVADDTYVAINLGSNDDVSPGMSFIIHNNGQYIASMVVTKVDLNASAGRVTLAKGDVTKNLQVMSSNF